MIGTQEIDMPTTAARTMTLITRLTVALTAALLLTPAAARAQSEEVVYYHTDAIGSVRAITDATGAVIERYDFLPFGEALPSTAPETRQFAGKERDAETGLDYFGARHHMSATGRFTTVDPVMPIEDALLDPQRWNRYSYVMNRPLVLTDPDGRCPSCLLFAQRLAQQGAQLASRYGTQAYNWATRFFNSPTGQEVTAAAAEAITGAQLPTAASTFGFARVEGVIEGFTYGRLANGAEVAARFSRAGDTLTTSVLGAFNADGTRAAGTLSAIVQGAQAVAKEQGASQLVIQAVGVVNQRLADLLVRQGFRQTTVRAGKETITAYEKLFEVYR